jgi:hypothetical protein
LRLLVGVFGWIGISTIWKSLKISKKDRPKILQGLSNRILFWRIFLENLGNSWKQSLFEY